MRNLRTLLAAALVVASVSAQSLSTPNLGGNGQSGVMFDIQATTDVCINSFDINLDPGTFNLEVYAVSAGGTFVGSEANAAAWTLLGSSTGVVSLGTSATGAGNLFTPTGISFALQIQAGSVQGFYVTVTGGSTGVNYTNGTAFGAPLVSDANITITQGTGNAYPFGLNFRPRNFNGTVNYVLGSCPLADYETNSVEAGLTFDGVQTNGFSPAVSTLCAGDLSAFATSSNLTLPWDLLVTLGAPLLPTSGGGLLTGSGTQVVNINLFDPSLFFLNGASFVFPFAPLSLNVPAVPGVDIAAQLVVLDAGSPDGLSLSQAGVLSGLAAGTGTVAGPIGDDTATTLSLGAPNCFGGAFTFAGTSFNQAFIISNGRVMFGALADTDFSPTVAEALTDNPFVGVWTDLNPALGGTISATGTGNGFVVNYNAVPYFGLAANPNTFSIDFNAGTGDVTVGGLQGMNPGATGAQFLGLSAGNLGATDDGAQTFTVGGAGTGVNASSMLYEFATGNVPSFAAGVDTLIFVPAGGLGYTWIGL